MDAYEGNIESFGPKHGDFDPKGRFKSAREKAYTIAGINIKHLYNWQRVAFLLIFTAISQGVVIGWLATRGDLVPYVIERDMTTGQAIAVGPAAQKEYIPQEAETKYFLAKFIEYTRNIPLDPVVYRKQWNSAAAFLTAHSSDKINRLISEEGQAGLIGMRTVMPKIISIQLMADTKNTYQVRWLEENFVIQGLSENTNVVMSGTFSVEYIRPKTEKELLVNPLGIHIKDFSWSRESEITKS